MSCVHHIWDVLPSSINFGLILNFGGCRDHQKSRGLTVGAWINLFMDLDPKYSLVSLTDLLRFSLEPIAVDR